MKPVALTQRIWIYFTLPRDKEIEFNLKVRVTPKDAKVELVKGSETVYRNIGKRTIRSSISGDYSLKVSKPGYETYEELIFLNPGKSYKREIILKPSGP